MIYIKKKYVLRDDKKIVSGYTYEPNCHGKLTIVNVLTDVNTDIWMYVQFTYKDFKYSMICFKNAYHTFAEFLKFNQKFETFVTSNWQQNKGQNDPRAAGL